MKYIIAALFLIFFPLSVYSFKDESHYSKTFGTTRFFRVFTPPDYNAGNSSKKYPVIYYFHGCGGSYKRSGNYYNFSAYIRELFDVVNLSASAQKIDFMVSTENTELLTILKNVKQVTIPAQSKIRVDSLFLCKGVYLFSFRNKGYIKIASSIDGIIQDRDFLIQVTIKNQSQQTERCGIKIFDGRSESLSLFKYGWGKWTDPMSSGIISEGSGNGNGKVEMGETFSIWIQPSSSFDSSDLKTWHPVIPINTGDNPDIYVEDVKQHNFSTGRTVLSAEIRLNRKPTKGNPVRIPVQSEFLKVQPLENDCHRNFADNFGLFYYEILLYEDGTAGMVRTG